MYTRKAAIARLRTETHDVLVGFFQTACAKNVRIYTFWPAFDVDGCVRCECVFSNVGVLNSTPSFPSPLHPSHSLAVLMHNANHVIVLDKTITCYKCQQDNDNIKRQKILQYIWHVAKKRHQAVGFPCNRMLKLSSSRVISIDVPVLSVLWSFEDHSVIIKALREGLIEHEASDTGGVPRWKSSCPDRLAEATMPTVTSRQRTNVTSHPP